MSKVNMTVDTKTGDIELSVDGEKIDGVLSLNLYRYNYTLSGDDEISGVEMDVQLESQKLGDGFRKLVRLVTADSEYAKANKQNEHEKYQDFLLFREQKDKFWK